VDARVHAAPAAPPSVARWAGITAESDEYRRVQVAGTYLYEYTTPVQALTEQGAGYWLLTPLCTPTAMSSSSTAASSRRRVRARATSAQVRRLSLRHAPAARQLVGLLRISEPGRLFMRANDPAENRWYSRDVAAIAAARGLPPTLDRALLRRRRSRPEPGRFAGPAAGRPHRGQLPNSHLVYALTWYALA
jgi:surfeit locus 1 family protein